MKSVLFLCAAVCLLLIPFISEAAGAAELPKTGQSKCYDENGDEINCAGTWQDGDIQAGVVWPNPRFTDNGDGTGTDNLAGLTWAKDGNLMVTRDQDFDTDDTANDGKVTWQHALDYIAKLNSENYLGHTDWRLPNVNEIQSLINADKTNSAEWLNVNGFENVQSRNYWSSSTYAGDTSLAWVVYMPNGYIVSHKKDSFYNCVWLVRSGQAGTISLPQTGQTKCYDENGDEINCSGTGQDGEIRAGVVFPEPRFTDNGDDTVTDNLTGLMWAKNADLAGETDWRQALDYVEAMNKGKGTYDYTDWRLPNRNELRSIVDYSNYDPAHPAGHPFYNALSRSYWSSSTDSTKGAWIVIMSSGSIYYGVKDAHHGIVWPVRAGQVKTAPAKSPDLIVKSLGFPGKIKTGKKINITAVIKNIGKKKAPSSSVQFYLSANNSNSIDGDMAIGKPKTTGKIKKKKTLMIKHKWKVTDSAGDYYLKAFCDSGNVITEADESNNIKASKKFRVK